MDAGDIEMWTESKGDNPGCSFEAVNVRCLESCNILHKHDSTLLSLEENLG